MWDVALAPAPRRCAGLRGTAGGWGGPGVRAGRWRASAEVRHTGWRGFPPRAPPAAGHDVLWRRAGRRAPVGGPAPSGSTPGAGGLPGAGPRSGASGQGRARLPRARPGPSTWRRVGRRAPVGAAARSGGSPSPAGAHAAIHTLPGKGGSGPAAGLSSGHPWGGLSADGRRMGTGQSAASRGRAGRRAMRGARRAGRGAQGTANRGAERRLALRWRRMGFEEGDSPWCARWCRCRAARLRRPGALGRLSRVRRGSSGQSPGDGPDWSAGRGPGRPCPADATASRRARRAGCARKAPPRCGPLEAALAGGRPRSYGSERRSRRRRWGSGPWPAPEPSPRAHVGPCPRRHVPTWSCSAPEAGDPPGRWWRTGPMWPER